MAIAFERAKEKGVDLKDHVLLQGGTRRPGRDQRPGADRHRDALFGDAEVQGTMRTCSLTRLVFFPIVEKATYKSWKDL